jgi:hypothetical protein
MDTSAEEVRSTRSDIVGRCLNNGARNLSGGTRRRFLVRQTA